MYAVIKTGGKQYKVAAGEKIKVEQLPADVGHDDHARPGPRRSAAAPTCVSARRWWRAPASSPRVVSHGRHDKVRIFKMRRRKHYQKRQGHRQNYTEIRISAVNAA